MSGLTTVYHAEVVGSMLRPPWLVEAREAMRAGKIAADEYEAIADRAVDEALRIQEAAGVDVVTDGEMRRDFFADLFIHGMEGFSQESSWTARFHGYDGDVAMEAEIPFTVTEKIKPRSSPTLKEFLAVRDKARLPLKVTLPSPTLISTFWSADRSTGAYRDVFELFVDAADALRDWMRELFDAGCRYLQIDDPELLHMFADPQVRADYAKRGIDPERFKSQGAEILGYIASVQRPEDAVLALHVCKGNGTQSFIAKGGYEDICREVFQRADAFDVFLMEFDDERSGSFEPLRYLPEEKVAVLGLVSTKWVALEDPELLRRRIEEASRFHPKERLALSPQCGFASASETAEQRMISEDTQSAKLKLVADVAQSVWA
jgi:5-methyltetrahydropteroyltriglutamate--homocysteine methyltransferase